MLDEPRALLIEVLNLEGIKGDEPRFKDSPGLGSVDGLAKRTEKNAPVKHI